MTSHYVNNFAGLRDWFRLFPLGYATIYPIELSTSQVENYDAIQFTIVFVSKLAALKNLQPREAAFRLSGIDIEYQPLYYLQLGLAEWLDPVAQDELELDRTMRAYLGDPNA